MDQERTGLERLLDFGRAQIARSKILGNLMFRTARLENERRRLQQQIGDYYCKLYRAGKGFEPPTTISALFSREQDIGNQLNAHYQSINKEDTGNFHATEKNDTTS